MNDIILWVSVGLICLVVIWRSIAAKKVEDEIKQLKKDVEELKKRKA